MDETGAEGETGEPPRWRTSTITDAWVHKLNWAALRFEELERSVDLWNAENIVLAPTRVPLDGEAVLQIFRPPALVEVPLKLWELQFNDCLHNLRSALDGLSWALAHADGARPAHPTRVAFPITSSPKEWKKMVGTLESIPGGLIERLRLCQPWARTEEQDPDPLALLSEADNHDKHRTEGFAFDCLPIVRHDVGSGEPLPVALESSMDWPLTPWMEVGLREGPLRGFGRMTPVQVVPIVIFKTRYQALPDAARWLHSEVDRVVTFVTTGQWLDAGYEHYLGTEWHSLGEP